MDPLTAIGAVASAAQLFDMSLDYSNRACKFIAAFNKAEEHATLLQQSTFFRLYILALRILSSPTIFYNVGH